MITEEQYNHIKHLSANVLKEWLKVHGFTFDDIQERTSTMAWVKSIKENGGPFCSCCGVSQKDGTAHNDECIWS